MFLEVGREKSNPGHPTYKFAWYSPSLEIIFLSLVESKAEQAVTVIMVGGDLCRNREV